MEKKLQRIIHNHFTDSDNNSDNWQLVLENSNEYISVFHLLNTVNYYVAYNLSGSSFNLSMVIYENKKAVGVMPLMAHKDENGKWILSSNGQEIVEPVFVKSLTLKAKKRIEKNLMDLIINLARELDITQFQLVNIKYFQVSSWYLMWAKKAKDSFSTLHLLVDLSLSLQEIRLKIRKSVKERIDQGLKEWKVEVHEKATAQLFEKFRLLHKLVAGRSTRPMESWQTQKKQIDSLESFIVTVSDKQNNLVGAGLYTYSRDIGVSSVSAYKRELFDKPLGHPVRMKAIELLKMKGVKWHEMGQRHLIIDKIRPTEKELSISHHKEGFATNIIARQHLVVSIN